ncbi:MAG: hypothetical protein U0075_17575 [Thermomicrobiales bacterium]
MPLSPTPRQVSPRSRIFQRAGKHGTALAFVLGGALILAPAASWVLPTPAAMAQDDATGQEATGTEVIAQGVTKLPKGKVAWLINKDAVPGGEGASVSSFPLGFGLTDRGAVEVRDEDGGTLGVLDRGEGFFLPSGKGGSLVSRTADDADFFVILLIPGEAAAGGSLPGTVVGDPFAAPETRDVEMELRRGVLRNDDEAVIPVSASGTPSLMLVTGGTAQLTGPDGQPVALGAGQYALLASGVSVRSADGTPAEFVVASIGDSVTAGKSAGDDGQAKTRTRTNNAGATAAGSSSGGRGGGGGGGGRAAGGSGGGGSQQGGATTGENATPEADQAQKDREARRQAREDRQNQNAGTPTPAETPQDVTPATPSPVADNSTDDTVDQDDEDIVIVDQDNTQVDDTDEQDASDPGTGDDTQVVETPVTEVPATDDGTTETTDPSTGTEPETPADESPVTEDPVVDQTSGDDAATDDTQQAADPNAVTQDPAVEQSDTVDETVVEQAAPEEVVVEQTAPEGDQSTSAGDAAPENGTTAP